MLNIKRSAVSVLMCAGIALMIPLVSLLPAKDKNLSAATESVSGIVTQEKSVSQLKKLYKNIKTYSKLFETEGSAKSPYKTYTLTKDARQSALDWINYYRYAARVPSITFDDKLNTDASYGALLDAAYGQLSHYPFYENGSYNKPSSMSQSMFNRGEYTTQTSNISALYSSSDYEKYVINSAVSGQMDDNSSSQNLNCVGHRRWLLNPYVQTMGIGSAYVKDGWNEYYTAVRVFSNPYNSFYDSSYGANKTTSNPGKYTYIAWPASGYNLSETFSPVNPWSVSLNSADYSEPVDSAITVKITRVSDNKTCTIKSSAYSDKTKSYLVTSNAGYGSITYCVIFAPGTDFLGTSALKGQYKVSISGLKNASGASTSLNYTVIFTSVNDADPTPSPKPTAKPTATPTPKTSSGSSSSGTKITMKLAGTIVAGRSAKAQVTVSPSSKSVTYSSSDSKIATVDSSGNVKGIMAGKVTVTAKTSDGAKASISVQILYKDVTEQKDFWYEPTYYLTNKNIVKGYDKQTNFKPANECTRAQMVTFLWRLSGEPAPNSSTCKFKDVEKSDYFYKAVIWAVEKGITTGTSKTAFSPSKVCTRAQTVTFLWRMAGKPAVGSAKNPFSDVEKGDYYHDAVIWASAKKIVAGYDDGTFRPQGKCLRRQMVTFLYKYDKNVK